MSTSDAESSDDERTLFRWFGPSWGAPVCRFETLHIPTPVDEMCCACWCLIAPGDNGIRLGRGLGEDAGHDYWHRRCFQKSIATSDRGKK